MNKHKTLLRVNLVVLSLAILLQISLGKTVDMIVFGDFHGALSAPAVVEDMTYGGAESMLYTLETYEGYDRNTNDILLISAGDNVTGQTLADSFAGIPVIEAYNLLGVDLSAVGNHEFDFGYEALAAMRELADFDFISANIQPKNDIAPKFAPGVILEQNGVKIGFIGIMSKDFVGNSRASKDYTTSSYLNIIKTGYEYLTSKGADVIVVLAHAGIDEVSEYINQLDPGQFRIPVVVTSHTHELRETTVRGSRLIGTGTGARNYARIKINFDETTKIASLQSVTFRSVRYGVNMPKLNNVITELITDWNAKLDANFSRVIGYTDHIIKHEDEGYKLFMSAIYAETDCDVAITNYGSIRSDLPVGELTVSSVMTIMPFLNALATVDVTGTELIRLLNGDNYYIGATKGADGAYYLTKDRSKIDGRKNYRIATSDYFSSGNRLDSKNSYVVLLPDWRTPAITWIERIGSDKENPLRLY